VNPPLPRYFFLTPRKKNKGGGLPFLFKAPTALKSFFSEQGVFMKGIAVAEKMETSEAVEVFERTASRFEQGYSKSYYLGADAFCLFPKEINNASVLAHDVSSVAKQFGITTPFYIGGSLYSHRIQNGKANVMKNIEVLCHAFLFAVDCDQNNSCVLDFTVPSYLAPSYTACAMPYGNREEGIIIT